MLRNLNFSAVGIFTTLAILPVLMDPINISKLFVLVIFLAILVYFQKDFILPKSKVVLLTLYLSIFFLIWILISSFANSQSIYSQFFGMWGRNNGLIYYFAIFSTMVLVSIQRKDSLSLSLLNGMYFLGIVFSIYAWLQYFRIDPVKYLFSWYDLEGNIALTLGNSNFASVMLGLTFTATLGKLASFKKFSASIFSVTFSLLLHVSLLPYIDTQGKIVYAVGVAIVVGVWLQNLKSRNLASKASRVWWILSLMVGLFGVAGLFGVGPFANMLANNVTNLKDRYLHWIAAFRIMKDHMLFGVGIDAFGDWHRRYRTIESIDLRGTPMSGTDNAHNVFLQIGSTIGLPALVAYLSIVILITYLGFVAIKDSNEKLLPGSLFAVWIGYQVQSLVSIDQIGIGVWGWIVGGSLLKLSQNNSEIIQKSKEALNAKKIKRTTLLKGGFLVVLLGISIAIIPTLSKEYILFSELQRMGTATSGIDFEKKSSQVLSVGLNVSQPKLRIIVATYLGKAGAAEKALLLAEDTTNKFPENLEAWHMVASIYESRGEYGKALEARARTVELDPLNEIFKDLMNKDQAK